MSYEHKCQSEVIRQMKGSKVSAIALDPMTEKDIGEKRSTVLKILNIIASEAREN